MRTKKLLAAVVLISVVLMPLGGCYKNIFPPRYEINQVEVVRIAGVDLAEDVESVFSGDSLERAVYKVQILSIIREQQSRADISNEASLRSLENQLSDQIKNEMLQVIEVSKKLGVDAIGLGEKIRLTHPVRWAWLESSWPGIFTDLDIGVEVTTQLRRTLSIDKPSGYEGGR